MECGWASARRLGRRREYSAWGTLEEAAPIGVLAGGITPTSPRRSVRPIGQVDMGILKQRPTGVGGLDRVLGGGIVPGAVILLAEEPGTDKSTLPLNATVRIARILTRLGPILYATGGGSFSQVKSRAERIGTIDEGLLPTDDNDLSSILGHVETVKPSLLLVNSAQAIQSPQVDGGTGDAAQVRAVTAALIHTAKECNMPVLLIGRVTKDGDIAGPCILEYLADVICHFEDERHARLHLLRAVKNRYGPTDKVGYFELINSRIRELSNPSGPFPSQALRDIPGSCATISLEGRRPIPAEAQALVAPSAGGSPRRITSGADYSRVAMILAVLQARSDLDSSSLDMYVSTVGGMRIQGPMVDLAIVIFIASAFKDSAPRSSLIAMGEIGLAGKLRACMGLGRRLQEAVHLGFGTVIVSTQGSQDLSRIEGMNVFAVPELSTAIRVALSQARIKAEPLRGVA